MTDKMREAYKMRRAKLAGLLIQGEDWPGAYRRAEEILSWSCFEAGWQASREALVIELPPVPEAPEDPEEAIDDSHMDAYHASVGMRHACSKLIEAAGLKVKS
ncbi:hypothetical protein YA0850_29650 [Pseudomonas veronii]|uniref:Phage protein n=1 Tax=Pseudomonas veronii TaxID=76761 RepID=A0ABS0VEB3_PSEVE|nr:hypothetical protein [Pseudomonas veronii]MBI6556531.1 hypothetical protein [Pseudomonas veronii]MBI6649853.1 hypothetical protein [Pseudomonas veronii]